MSVNQAQALFHLWEINEIFSDDSGTIQFIELFTTFDNQQLTFDHDIEATQGISMNTFTFPGNTPTPTGGHHLLLATSGFASLPSAPTPDFTLPDGFLFAPDGMVNFVGADSVSYTSLPTDGVLSLAGDGTTTQTNSPTNYAATSGSVVVPIMVNPIPEAIEKGTVKIELETIAVGLTSPVYLTHDGNDPNKLYVVDQGGQIRIIKEGILLKTPFLEVSDRLVELGFFGTLNPFTDFDERGILGLAFHPDFADSFSSGYQKLYTYTSEPNDFVADFTVPLPGGVSFNHQAVIAEWTVDVGNSNIVDITSRRELMRIDEPQFNHDGGMVAFGPDGLLYISLGDGGNFNDIGDGHGSTGNGQEPNNILGTILRIDVEGSDSANGEYGIPGDNPFVGDANVLDEIYAYGFRNPWRFSFDSNTGDLIVGDVGQGLVEEVDIVVAGGNYGWNLKEGTFRFDPNDGSVSNDLSGLPLGLIDPVAEYDHDEGSTVIGGFVYHGTEIPELQGKYVFGDFSRGFFTPEGRLFYADLGTGEIKELILGLDDRDLGLYVKAFGQDADGELYLLAGTNLGPFGARGQVLKITNADCTPGQLHVIPGDLNFDCLVNFLDLAVMGLHWVECAPGPEVDCGI
jgi:glucose/arabinose dehydrogenase